LLRAAGGGIVPCYDYAAGTLTFLALPLDRTEFAFGSARRTDVAASIA